MFLCTYLDSMFTRDGLIDADVERRVNAGNKLNGVNNQSMSKKARLAVHNGVLVHLCMKGNVGYGKRGM